MESHLRRMEKQSNSWGQIMKRATKKPGKYTLPLPPLPGPERWMAQALGHWEGRIMTPAWAIKYGSIKHIKAMTPAERRRDLANLPITYEEDRPDVRADHWQGVERWSERKQEWVPCDTSKAIAYWAGRA